MQSPWGDPDGHGWFWPTFRDRVGPKHALLGFVASGVWRAGKSLNVAYRVVMVADVSSMTEDQRALFCALPLDGTSVGNLALRQFLSWNRDRYFDTRDQLVNKGAVVRGRGRGGAIRRTEPELPVYDQEIAVIVEADSVAAATIEVGRTYEAELYEPMRAVIANAWAQDHLQDLLAVEITALQGSPSGIWSRPDITTVEVRTFQYLPGKYLEINTFEVKSTHAVNVQAVYEALAHRRAATRSYVLFYIPPDQAAGLQNVVAVVVEAARTHGVGVVIAADPYDYETWEELEEAQRFEPDPERLDSFIATQLS